MTCRKCKHLDVNFDVRGRPIVRARNAYRCTVDVPEPPLPASMKKRYSYHWPLGRAFVTSQDGVDCPFFEERS